MTRLSEERQYATYLRALKWRPVESSEHLYIVLSEYTMGRSAAELRKEFLHAMQFRHACRLFDTERRAPREDIEFLLEVGRLSPSSFGLEPWRFVIVEDPKLKVALQEACMQSASTLARSARFQLPQFWML